MPSQLLLGKAPGSHLDCTVLVAEMGKPRRVSSQDWCVQQEINLPEQSQQLRSSDIRYRAALHLRRVRQARRRRGAGLQLERGAGWNDGIP